MSREPAHLMEARTAGLVLERVGRPDRGRARGRRGVGPARRRPPRLPMGCGQGLPQLRQMNGPDPRHPCAQEPGRSSQEVDAGPGSMKWIAFTGVTPGWSGSLAKGAVVFDTVTLNGCVALRPPGSVAVTRIVAAPSSTAVNVTTSRAARALATCGADDHAV